tara:strand:- start:1033 stop:1887 length:855 start_codon:yes stop_codon:yes gene_type:complete
MPLSNPTQEYSDAVKTAISERKGFKGDDELITALAESCWNHNWPLDKAYFQSDIIQFSDEDSVALDDYIERAKEYRAVLATEPDQDIEYEDYEIQDPEGDDDDMTAFNEAIMTALGLDVNSSPQLAIQAIAALKTAGFTEEERSSLAELKTASRMLHYTELIAPLDGIPGTVRDNAEKLVKLEATLGEEEAMSRFEEWKAMQQTLETAGVTRSLLYPNNPNEDETSPPEVQSFSEFKESNDIKDDGEATRRFAESDPAGFMRYREARTGRVAPHRIPNPSGRPR